MTNAPAGWYPAPDKPGNVRYWDGNAWTDQYQIETPQQAKVAANEAKRNAKILARNAKIAAKEQRVAAKVLGKAESKYSTALAAWQETRDAQAAIVNLVTTYSGDTNAPGLMLKPGETLFGSMTGVSLIEERAGQGEFVGRSQGFSVPIGSLGGHAIRYRVGASQGHYVAAAPVPTAIDQGNFFITNQRVLFQGTRQTRECLFAKLAAFQTSPNGAATFSVSNRQKPTVIRYGRDLASWFDLRLEMAMAHYRGSLPDLIAKAQADLNSIDATRPVDPAVAITTTTAQQ
jgi:hypothetical protein